MKVNVIIERGNKEFWGRIEGYEFLPVTVGSNVEEVLENLKTLIADYIKHEGKDNKNWKRVEVNKITFDAHYDLTASSNLR